MPKRLLKKYKGPPQKSLPPSSSKEQSFWIVGIGASAGGMEALHGFFESLHDNTGMAFVVLQHGGEESENMLASILSRLSPMPVRIVKDGLPVKANHVYVVPPRYSSEIKKRVFSLRSDSKNRRPITSFFESIAKSHKNCAAGIILSGTGDDGAQGLKAIRHSGGRTYVQNEGSASFTGMIESSLRTNSVDAILSPEDIAKELNEIGFGGPCKLDEDFRHIDSASLEEIFQIIFSKTRLDFSSYKATTIQRRISRRMKLLGSSSVRSYISYIKKHPEEITELYEDLLINVTRFFRDMESFEVLRKKVFPSILKNSPSNIRIWVPGCSTGEEVYSLAITLLEYLGERRSKTTVQIFGTDVSESSLEKARNGVYKQGISEQLTPEQLKRFFVKVQGGYQIAKFLRDMCIFARQDVTRDPPFSKMDLISCRNLLIYLDSTLQDKVVPIFHYALKQKSYLMLGSSESIRHFSHFFSPVDKKINLYIKGNTSTPQDVTFSLSAPYSFIDPAAVRIPAGKGLTEKEIFKDMTDLLTEHTPPSILINENLEVLHFRGNVRRFLDFPAGKASLNLQKMMKGALLYDVRQLMDRVKSGPKKAAQKLSEVKVRGKYRQIFLMVLPLRLPAVKGSLFLVLFQDVTDSDASAARTSPRTGGEEAGRLKKELEVTREFLEASIEKHETMNEELRSANEEILSSNEELQSTNEELETAKEELQSTNEELTTVNESLKESLEQLKESNDQLAEAQAIAHLGSWSWDVESNVVAWSDELYRIYGVERGTRMTYESVLSRIHPDDKEKFDEAIKGALKTKKFAPFQHRIIRGDGKVRYLDARGHVISNSKGRVIRMTGTGQDTTDFHTMENAFRSSEEKFRVLVEQVQDYAIFLLDPQGFVQTWNVGAERIMGYTHAEIVGRHFSKFYPEKARAEKFTEKELAAAVSQSRVQDEGWRVRKDGSRFWALTVITALYDDAGNLKGFAKVTRDMTEKRRTEELLLETNESLERRVKERTKELEISEARYQDLYQHSPDMLLSADVKTKKIIRCNQTLLSVLGYKEHEVVGKPLFDFYHPGDLKQARRNISEIAKSGEVKNSEMRILCKSGSYLPVVLNATGVKDEKGRVTHTRSSWRDISERKASENALRESEEKFRTMADFSPTLIWMSGPDGKCTYFNRGWLQFTGRTLAKETGDGWTEGVHPEDFKRFISIYLDAVKMRKPFIAEYRLRHRSGKYRWILSHGAPLFTPSKEFRGFIGSCIDIDDRMAAEEEVRRNEERFRTLISATSSIIWTTDAEGMFSSPQSSWENYTGQTWEEHKNSGWKKAFHKDDLPQIEKIWLGALKSKRAFWSEGRLWSSKHGEYRYFAAQGAPVKNPDGTIKEWIGTISDVHSQKTAEHAYQVSEQRYRSTFHNAAVGIIHADLSGRFTLLNKKFCEITGYSEQMLLKKSFQDITHPEDVEKDVSLFNKLIRGEIDHYNMEKRYIHRKGRVVWIDLTVSLLRNAENAPIGGIGVIEDITARKKAEEALRESRERLNSALLASQTGTFRWDLLTNEVEFDRSLNVLFGLDPEKGLSSLGDFIKLVHKEDRAGVVESLRRSAEQGADFYMTYRIVKPDGSVRWFLDRGTTVRDARGKGLYMTGACVDVTAYKEAEKALELSTERIQLIAESVDIGLWYCDLPFDKLVWNDQCKKHFGLPPDAEVTIGTFYELIYPDDREKTRSSIEKALESRIPYDTEYRTLGPDGIFRWIRAIGRGFYDAKGKPIRFDGVTVDITALKQSEQRLQQKNEMLTTLNTIGRTLSAELDIQNLVQFVTDASTMICKAQFGAFFYNVKREGEEAYTLYTISGVPREHFSKFPMPRNTEVFGPTFRGEGTVRIADVKKDPRYGKNNPHSGMPKGHLPVTSYLAVPVISRTGEVIGGLFFEHPDEGVFTEDHERVVEALAAQAAIAMDNARLYERLQKELAEKQTASEILARQAEDLYRTNEDLRQFAYIASHDLQEPLRTVTTFTELLSDEYRQNLDDKANEYMEITNHAARRAQNLVDDLLDYCRLDKPDEDFEPVKVSEVVQQTMLNLMPVIEESKAEILYGELPELKANRVQLGQLFQNLIGNAIKFRSKERPRVKISARPENDGWLFSVEDNGIGLDEKYADKIFVIFQRLHHRSEYEGTGIGLAICKRIVERHGGRIWVKSSPGKGAAFFFNLKTSPGEERS